MSGGIKGANLGGIILRELQAYREGLITELDNAAKRSANRLRNTLKETSPKDTGDYAGDWRVKEIPDKAGGSSRYVVHNKDNYRLTHLLEYGHSINGGTGTAKALPHIEPARDEEEKRFLSDVEGAISNVN